MAIKYFKIEKLVRDKIPAFLKAEGIEVYIKGLAGQDYASELQNKLLEEVQEVLETASNDELCEELADVLEVIHALSKANGLTIEEIEQRRLEKREIKGGFEKKIFNTFVEIEESNPSISYYLNNPKQYPEIHSDNGVVA